MLNIRSLRTKSRLRLTAGETLLALGVILPSIFTLSFTSTCCGANNVSTIGLSRDPAALSGQQAESSGRIIAVLESSRNMETAQVSPLDFDDWRRQNKVFDHMAAFVGGGLKLTKNGRHEEISRTSVSSGFFETLGAKPFLGRVFTIADEEPGRDDVVILSYSLWQRHFGSDPDIIGKKVLFNTDELTVAGVMPKRFEYPGQSNLPADLRYQSHTEAWTPLTISSMHMGRGFRLLSVIARLRAGVTLSEAQQEMEAIANNLQQQNPQTNNGWGVHLVALQN